MSADSVRGIINDEFQVKRFALRHNNLNDFVCSQWQLPREKSIIYVGYKVIVAITYCVILVNSMVEHATHKGTLDFYFLNLTNWGCLTNTLYGCIGAALVIYHNFKRKLSERRQLPGIMKFYWLLFYICINNSFVVTTLYWGLVYKPNDEFHRIDVNNVLIHIVNSVVMMVELFVNAIPIRILHVAYPFVFEAVYTGFTVVYYLCGGLNVRGKPYIYKALDWSIPQKTIGPTIGAFVWMAIMHTCFFIVYKLKVNFYNQRFLKPKNIEDEKLQNGSSDSSEIK